MTVKVSRPEGFPFDSEDLGWHDIGSDVLIRYAKTVSGDVVALTEAHPRQPQKDDPPGLAPSWCYGSVAFDVPSAEWPPGRPVWKVITLEPLTLEPSLQCRTCGHHGFIIKGHWTAHKPAPASVSAAQ